MFGLIVSGRPVDAAPQAITDTQYAFRAPATPAFNHIVVFLLPGTQLPLDAAATVYVQLPFSSEFKLLGGIGAGKESAIFKISGLNKGGAAAAAAVDGDMMTDAGVANGGVGAAGSGGGGGGEIVVGVSIEPAAQVEAQLAQLKGTAASSAPVEAAAAAASSMALVRGNAGSGDRVTTKVLAQRIIGNAFNFLASFGSDTVPLKAFQDWWTKFEKKVELDPSFLERGE